MSIQPSRFPELLDALCLLARWAGDVILEAYGSNHSVHTKADASPVTDANHRAEAIIVPALEALAQGVPKATASNTSATAR